MAGVVQLRTSMRTLLIEYARTRDPALLSEALWYADALAALQAADSELLRERVEALERREE